MMLQPQTLVNAHLYPDLEAVVQDALRSLLQEKPQLRIELAVYRYQTEDLSLAKAAHLAGLSFDSFKALLVQRGIQPRLGPADEQDAHQEIAAVEQVLSDRAAR
jgi:predicted HTH domain antitoxin